MSHKYIEYGEKLEVSVKKGGNKGQKIKGVNHLSSVQSNRPKWYNVREIKPGRIILNRFIRQRHFVSLANSSILAGDACAIVYPISISTDKLWYYMNSSIFIVVEELYGRRMGGGGGALEILAGEFSTLPVPNLTELDLSKADKSWLQRPPQVYLDEIKNELRRDLDKIVLLSMGVNYDNALDALYRDLEEVIEDRLAKAEESEKEEEDNDQDN